MRWLCSECDWNGDETEMLVAPNPFDPEQVISGCPDCKAVGTLTNACDEPGCARESSASRVKPGILQSALSGLHTRRRR